MNIDPNKFYNSERAAALLRVKPETVKAYCRKGKLHGKQVGPRSQWMVPGKEIVRLRKEWRLD